MLFSLVVFGEEFLDHARAHMVLSMSIISFFVPIKIRDFHLMIILHYRKEDVFRLPQ
jgi:hypothetical protein